MTVRPALLAEGIRKNYGELAALDGFDLTVAPGTIHGLLGPNGAGKSTAVRSFATLTRFDHGRALVAGHDVTSESAAVRAAIGVVGQQAAVDEILGGAENLVMFGRLYGLTKAAAQQRAAELLDIFGLTAAADRAVSTYSGGMRRRLDIAAALIRRPAVLFLDEPTTGLDPRARSEVWDSVREIAEAGTTVLLTTQYLDEADQLAATVSVMADGKVIAEGSPDVLKRQRGGDRVTVSLPEGTDPAVVVERLGEATGQTVVADAENGTVTVQSGSGVDTLLHVVRTLDALDIPPTDLILRRPTLDEVFLALTSGGSR